MYHVAVPDRYHDVVPAVCWQSLRGATACVGTTLAPGVEAWSMMFRTSLAGGRAAYPRPSPSHRRRRDLPGEVGECHQVVHPDCEHPLHSIKLATLMNHLDFTDAFGIRDEPDPHGFSAEDPQPA